MFSFATRCTCLTGCGASSPRSPQASGSSEIHRHVTEACELNDSLYFFDEPEGTPTVQILFFHGLQPEENYSEAHVSTWTDYDHSCIWPQTWLLEKFPNAHMLYVCYTKGLRKSSNGTMDMYNVGENLVSDLLQGKIGSSCPVVLVGHSIGGLVIKEMCKKAHDMLHVGSKLPATKLKAFLNNIKGIFYFSTPHHGIQSVNTVKDHFGSSLSMYFATLSRHTERLNAEFQSISKVYNWLFAGVGEALPTHLGGSLGVFVPEASSMFGVNFNLVEEANHFSICRPRSRTSRNFWTLVEFIQAIINDLKEDHAKATTSKVSRVLLQFPMDDNYVVLETTMAKVREALESANTGPVVTLVGGPGQGKTCMAKYLAFQYHNASMVTSSAFEDGVAFLPCGADRAGKNFVYDLWHILGYELLPSMEVTDSFLSSELTRRLSTQKLLIILDDVCDPLVIKKLLFPGKRLKYLVTTQIPQLWSHSRCVEIPLARPTSKEAYQILTINVYGGLIDISEPLEKEIHAIAEKADCLPLVLANMAAHIRRSIQGENDQLAKWKYINNSFEGLIKNEHFSSSVVSFNHPYPNAVIKCMDMALGSLNEPTRDLLLLTSIFDSQPVPEIVIKLFFKRDHGNLLMFPICSKHLQDTHFIQIGNHARGSTIPANKTWSLHAMRQTFIGFIKGDAVKSMGNKFLECNTEEDNLIIELLLLYGQDHWRDKAVERLGIQNDSSQERSLQLAPIKSFVQSSMQMPRKNHGRKIHTIRLRKSSKST